MSGWEEFSETVQTRKAPYRAQVLRLLSDFCWHSWRELRLCGGVRYGARLLELLRVGYRIEKRPNEDGREYRLASLVRGEPKVKRVKWYLSEEDAQLLLSGQPELVSPEGMRSLTEALRSFREHRDNL